MTDATAELRAEVERLRREVERLGGRGDEVARQTAALQRVTAALAATTRVQDVAAVTVGDARALFGATVSLCYLVEGDALALVAHAGVDEAQVENFRRVPLDAPRPLPDAVRRGAPVWLASPAELAAAYPDLAAARIGDAPLLGLVVVPLRDAQAVVGGLVFTFHEARALDALDRDFFRTVAAQCGLALERARAFAAERRANERLQAQQARLTVLARAGETLAASLDSRRALVELTQLAVPARVDWCAIDELGADGTIERLVVAHRDPAKVELAERLGRRYPPRADAPHGVPAVLRTGRVEWVPEIPDALLVASTEDEEHLALARSLALTAYAVVPLVARGRVLGALSLVSEGERRLTDDDLRFAEDLARRAALALDNARLYEAAEAARAHLHDLFMQAPAAIGITRGREHRFELANAPYQRLVGRADLVGEPLRAVLPADAAIARATVQAYEAGAPLVAAEQALGPGDAATERRFNVVYQPTRDAAGAVDGVATFAFEVTDQVAARREVEALAADVARSEARLRALVDATAAIVWTATASGEVVEVSPSWLAFTGQTAAEYRDEGFLRAIHPDDRAAMQQRWTAAVASGGTYAAEYRLRRHDGGWAHTLARGVPVRQPDGTITGYVGCNVDVTELRQAEADARAHAETLATIDELGRTIAAELDQQKLVQAVTDAVTSLTGAQFGAFFYNVLDDAGGRYMLFTISGVPRERFSRFPMPRNTAVFAPTFGGEGVVRVDDITADPRYGHNAPRRGMPEGHLPVRSYLAVPVVSRSGEVIGGIFLGHERRGVFGERAETLAVGLAAQAAVAMDNARLYGDAQRLIRALEATNRELDQFAYVTSHDLRAPLRGIGSLAEWLEEDLAGALTEDARHKLALLRGRVRRMEGLIQGILDFSRAGRLGGAREDVDVARLVVEAAELLAVRPPARVVVDGELPVLHTVRVAFQQVLMNLIGNALKHAGRPDVEVRVGVRDAGDAWEFTVADNGPGIAPAYHDRVWGIFQTLAPRDRVESTGIGLAIVKKIVEGVGGRVGVDSAEGRGATFRFTWPRGEDRA